MILMASTSGNGDDTDFRCPLIGGGVGGCAVLGDLDVDEGKTWKIEI